MKIEQLTTNRLKTPLGTDLKFINLAWKVTESTGKKAVATRVKIALDEAMTQLVHDSGNMADNTHNHYQVNLNLKPRSRYYWMVWIEDDLGECGESEKAWFETGKLDEDWIGKWIAGPENPNRMPVLYKEFTIEKQDIEQLKSGRLYCCGLGLYEAYINGEKVGDEYLQPGYHSYDQRIEYQSYDVTSMLRAGDNKIAVLLGEGWYKGRFGFDGNYQNLYGMQKKLIGELCIRLRDETEQWIITDKSWKVVESEILSNGIYDGEYIDCTLNRHSYAVRELLYDKDTELLTERTNPPLRKIHTYEPALIRKEDYGYLLDFGQTITGWVELEGELKKGQRIHLQYGEILQDNQFYRDNLRTAKAEFIFVSDGVERTIRPHFTYYGFRYVKVQGLEAGQEIQFHACQIMSDIPQTGQIVTGNEKVNTLFENTMRSQKCNFLDIPTDCPQRDERMGWTGDVTAFVRTACFHMDCEAFFRHYSRSLAAEQKLWKGAIPFFAPAPKVPADEKTNPFYVTAGACGWGDVATVLPWTLFEYYGDIELLREQYPMMCAWSDYVTNRTRQNKIPYLWQNDMQLGDWLALDNGNPENPIGKSDPGLLASAFYYLSVVLCMHAAKTLQEDRYEEFFERVENIRKAFLSYYFDGEGELTVPETQTIYVILLAFGLYPEGKKEKLAMRLHRQLMDNQGLLNTGFVGTPLLCQVLSENGMNEEAYGLLLNEQYPGWLYEVNLGATTMWERWNSVDDKGVISAYGMNSLNHYAYGSIADWMYRYVCGFRPSMHKEVKMTIQPQPAAVLHQAKGEWDSPYGKYVCQWKYEEEKVHYRIKIPFNANARLIMPNGEEQLLEAGEYDLIRG